MADNTRSVAARAVQGRWASALTARIPRIPRAHTWLAVGVGLVAFALAVWRSGQPSLWFDEAFAVGLAGQPLHVMWRYLWGQESQMTLYYVLLHFWLDLLNKLGAGRSELLLRLPSVTAAALAAAILYLIGARWWNRATGLIAAAAFACNPLLLRQAQEARGYTLQVLLQILAWYCFLIAVSNTDASAGTTRGRRSLRWWALFAGISALAIYAQIDTVVCLAAFPAALVGLAVAPVGQWRRWARASLIPCMISLMVTGALAAPLGVDAAIHGNGISWVPAASLSRLETMTQNNLLAGVGWMIWPLLACVALAVLPRGLVRPFSPVTLVALIWFIVPFALFWVIPHFFLWRYLVVVIAPLSLLIGIGVGRLQPPPLRIGVALLLVVLLAQLPGAYYAETRDDYRTAATWLQPRLQPGDGVVCWPGVYCSIPMGYYIPRLASATYPGGWDWIASAHTSGQQARTYISKQQRIWLILAPHGAYNAAAVNAERTSLVAAGFSPGEHIYTPAVQIILYVRIAGP